MSSLPDQINQSTPAMSGEGVEIIKTPETCKIPEQQITERMVPSQFNQGPVKCGQSSPPFDPRYNSFGHPYYPPPPYYGYYPLQPPQFWHTAGPNGWQPRDWPPANGNGGTLEEWHRLSAGGCRYPTSGDLHPAGMRHYNGLGHPYGLYHPCAPQSEQREISNAPARPGKPAKNAASHTSDRHDEASNFDHDNTSVHLSKLRDMSLDSSMPCSAETKHSVGKAKDCDPMTPTSMKVTKSLDEVALADEKIQPATFDQQGHDQVDNGSNCTGLGSSVNITKPIGFTLDTDRSCEPVDQPLAGDIRGSIAPAHDLQLSMEGKMFKQAWSNDPNMTLTSESYIAETVHAWQAAVQPARNIDFKELTKELVDRSDYEFDPAELEFKSALEAGETKTYPDNQHNMDAKRERRMYSAQQQCIKEDRARVPAVPREAIPQEALEPPFACHLRPATEEDLPSIKEIYDLEITQGFQARDKVKIPAGSYVGLLKMCKERSLPFIVAIAGAPHDVRDGKTPEVAWNSKEPPKGTVLGFSFLSPYHRGFCNDLSSAGDSSVRIDVMIHPHHRAMFIGTALIDKMLQLVCPRYDYMDTCQFVDESAVPLYRGAHTSLHRFYHIYVDVLVAGDQDPNANRYDKLLMDRFNFEKLSVVHGTHEHKTGMLDLVIYHKQCRPAFKSGLSEHPATRH